MMKKLGVFLGVFFLFQTALKAENFFVSTVSVDTEAQNQAQAKDMALKEAYRKAFLEVSKKVASAAQYALLEDLTDDQLAHFIRETSVVSERGSKTTYHADLKVSVNGELLKQFLAENEAPDLTENDYKVLIVPLMESAEETGTNPWKDAWLEQGLIGAKDLVFEVWKPDLKKTDTYASLRTQSGIKNIYVVYATMPVPNVLQVRVVDMRSHISERFQVSLAAENIYARSIAEVVRRIANKRPKPDLNATVDGGFIQVVYRYQRLADWLSAEKKLKTLENVEKVETGALSGGKVSMKLVFKGTFESLEQALFEEGFHLRAENNFYILE